MNAPPIVTPQEWAAARDALLVKEKELTRARDALAAERRRMPRMAVEKEYRFEGPDGPVTLAQLFGDKRQLIVQHGGILWTDPVPSGGTRVSFCIPAHGGETLTEMPRGAGDLAAAPASPLG